MGIIAASRTPFGKSMITIMSQQSQNTLPPPASTARGLIRSLDRGTLATMLEGGKAGTWPYASLVLTACDLDASPLLLLSDLAEHTKNLARNPHASLLFDGTAGRDDPLTGARVTVIGEIAPDADSLLMERFVNRHPSAAAYAGFKDFRIYRMRIVRAHLVAGFGRIHWIETSDLLYPAAVFGWLRSAERDILQHMNEDHAVTIDLYAQHLLAVAGEGWRMTGVDPEGSDLRRLGEVARLDFPNAVADLNDVRQVFAALAQLARHQKGSH
jgi:heme oxygenase (biliverdin-IX-beta and delta-forming)